ncbi:MAG: NAD(P)-binding domain-containing protein [Bryobacterales bacterium]|nr:NAD(P)-binding domain-containing protein [Bryobacteraceae bacterium]MDW8130907.1 NAD(P)-binding domain-containing protein [Bryobacterales bacterium]
MQDEKVRIGFIGFGQVGSLFASLMLRHGADVAAYDPVREKVTVPFLEPADLAARSDCIVSTVTTQAALEVAVRWQPLLRQGQLYVDLNSTAPRVKQQIEKLVGETPAGFAEGVILGAVGAEGPRVRILTGGPQGRRAAELLRRYGLDARFFSEQTGQASCFKMLRSVFSKGVEALLVEMLVAARRAGFAGELFRDLSDFMSANSFERVASNWISSHLGACERRYHELRQVTETLRGLDVTPIMSLAAEAFFDRSRAMAASTATRAASWQEAIELLERRLARPVA